MDEYRVLITDEILEFGKLRRRDRDKIRAFVHSLRNDPFQEGDYRETDLNGRNIHVKIVGKIALTFWADHAVKEVKITKVRHADF